MKIYLAADHAGFGLKNEIEQLLIDLGYNPQDCGAFELNKDDDYPDFIADAARKVANDPQSLGIVLGKSGAGECIAANKIKGVRAFLAVNEHNVRLAREHNDANIMSLGAEIVNSEDVEKLVKLFLETPFSNAERHVRRIAKISELEKEA